MPALDNAKYEAIVQAVARNVNPTDAYVSQGYSVNSAASCVGRLMKTARFRARLSQVRAELQTAETQRIVTGEVLTGLEVAIAEKNQQVRVYWKDFLATEQIIAERKEFFGDPNNALVAKHGGIKNFPGARSGFIVLRYRSNGLELQVDTALFATRQSLMDKVGRLVGFIDAPQVNFNQTNNTAIQATTTNIGGMQPKDAPPLMAERSSEQLQRLMELALACKAAGVPVELPESLRLEGETT